MVEGTLHELERGVRAAELAPTCNLRRAARAGRQQSVRIPVRHDDERLQAGELARKLRHER